MTAISSARTELALNFGELLHRRRATPTFEDTPVPTEDLDRMLEFAREAPSGYNFQPWRFLLLRDPQQRARLREAAFDQPKITQAPVMVVAFAPREAWKETADEILKTAAASAGSAARDPAKIKSSAFAFLDKLDRATWLNRQVMIAFTYLMLAAEVLGWDTAPMEGFDAAAVRRALALPEDSEVVALLAIGRAKEPRKTHPGRLPVGRIAFDDRADRPWRAGASRSA
ncbi:MAG: nitroreductase family protein [Opitutaceae bacterium]